MTKLQLNIANLKRLLDLNNHMQITDDLIDKISGLCKLEFQGAERENLKHEFKRMLDFVAQLQEVDTSGVEPLIHITEEVNQTRVDEPRGRVPQQEALKNAPKQDGTYFRVPKVIDR